MKKKGETNEQFDTFCDNNQQKRTFYVFNEFCFFFAVPISSEISFQIQELKTKYNNNNKNTHLSQKTHTHTHILTLLCWTRLVCKHSYLFFYFFFTHFDFNLIITSSPGYCAKFVCVRMFPFNYECMSKIEFALLQGEHIYLIDRLKKINHELYLI